MDEHYDPEQENTTSFEEEQQERIWLREVYYIPLGERALAAKDYQVAVSHFLEAVQLDPYGDSSARYFLGNALLWLGRLQEAAGVFNSDVFTRRNQVSFFLGEWCQIAILASEVKEGGEKQML